VPTPTTQATLHLWPAPADEAERLVAEARADGKQITIECSRMNDDRSVANLRIQGPHDVLRWLADEVDAWWT